MTNPATENFYKVLSSPVEVNLRNFEQSEISKDNLFYYSNCIQSECNVGSLKSNYCTQDYSFISRHFVELCNRIGYKFFRGIIRTTLQGISNAFETNEEGAAKILSNPEELIKKLYGDNYLNTTNTNIIMLEISLSTQDFAKLPEEAFCNKNKNINFVENYRHKVCLLECTIDNTLVEVILTSKSLSSTPLVRSFAILQNLFPDFAQAMKTAYGENVFISLITSESFNEYLKQFPYIKDYRHSQEQATLAKLLSTKNKKMITKLQAQINTQQIEIQRYETAIIENLNRITAYSREKFALEYEADSSNIDQSAKDLLQMLNTPSVESYMLCPNKVRMSICTFMNNYSSKDADKVINNIHRRDAVRGDHYLYSTTTIDKLKAILKAIFVDEQFLLRTTCNVVCTLSLNNSSDRAITRDSEVPYSSTTLLGQPHIVYANCFGEYHTPISKAIFAMDYARAIELILASAANINWMDTVVVDRLIYEMTKSLDNEEMRYIYDPETKTYLNCKEAYDKITGATAEVIEPVGVEIIPDIPDTLEDEDGDYYDGDEDEDEDTEF